MTNQPPLAQKKQKGQGDNGHDLGKRVMDANNQDNQDVQPQGSGSQRVNAFLRIRNRGQNKETRLPRQEAVDQPRPPRNRFDDDLRHFILDAVPNHGKREARTPSLPSHNKGPRKWLLNL